MQGRVWGEAEARDGNMAATGQDLQGRGRRGEVEKVPERETGHSNISRREKRNQPRKWAGMEEQEGKESKITGRVCGQGVQPKKEMPGRTISITAARWWPGPRWAQGETEAQTFSQESLPRKEEENGQPLERAEEVHSCCFRKKAGGSARRWEERALGRARGSRVAETKGDGQLHPRRLQILHPQAPELHLLKVCTTLSWFSKQKVGVYKSDGCEARGGCSLASLLSEQPKLWTSRIYLTQQTVWFPV